MPTEQRAKDPRPGDFVPPDRTPRPPRKDGESVEEKMYPSPPKGGTGVQDPKTRIPVGDAEQQATERAKLYEEMATDLSPIADYQAYLKEMEISEEKAQEIVDSLFTQGFYSEKHHLTKRISATLRTREHEDTLRLQTFLEAARPIYMHVMQEITTRYNLAASLESFGETTFEFPPKNADKKVIEDLFDIRLKFVERMADPAFYKLSTLLAKLDRTVAAVMREGVAENF